MASRDRRAALAGIILEPGKWRSLSSFCSGISASKGKTGCVVVDVVESTVDVTIDFR
jgi:hypothetical protein